MAGRLEFTDIFLFVIILTCSVTEGALSVGQKLHSSLLSVSENETTYFKETKVYQYNNYGSLEIFQVSVPPGTALLRWYLTGAGIPRDCTGRKIISHMQPNGYPLFTPDGRNASKTFPSDNFYLNHAAQYDVTVMSNDSKTHILHINYPLPGQWFLVSYVSEKVDQVIKKITSSNCRYAIGVQAIVSVPKVGVTQDISYDNTYDIFMHTDILLYKFYMTETAWKYKVILSDCKVENGTESDCPVGIQTRGGSFPSPAMKDSHMVHCKDKGPDCELEVYNPLLDNWHYMTIMAEKHGNISFKLTVHKYECDPHHLLSRINPISESTEGDHGNPASENDTKLRFHMRESEGADAQAADISEVSSENGTKNDNISDATQLPRHVITSENQTHPVKTADNDGDMKEGTGNITNIPSFQPVIKGKCPSIYRLQRVESANSDYYTEFTLTPTSGHEVLYLQPKDIGLIRFDVLPLKDTSGTLRILTHVTNMNYTQNVSVKTCVQVDRLPVNGDDRELSCKGNDSTFFNITRLDSRIFSYFPYPRVGKWFLAMQAACSNKKTGASEECRFDRVPILVDIRASPCVDDGCGRYGNCQSHSKGVFDVTACSCVANYQGYSCTDATNATTDHLQFTYTLLLTLSNMFFWPAIIVSIYRRYYAEAVVYFANMFFSTMYHACDVASTSIFKKCIMPYGVLSFCDFFCSIMSFWVTLLAISKLSPNLKSVATMIGVFGLAMGVQWQTHGIWTNAVAIGTGIVIMITSWIVQCARSKKCYPQKRYVMFFIPGIAMAGLGICIFAFIETDANYPYTHSAWHVCMSTCVVFLLPNKKQAIKDETESEASDMIDLGGVSDRVGLMPGSGIDINTGDIDDLLDL